MSVNAEPNDAELVGRMASGDREAFADLFRRHQATVFRFSRRCSEREAAEDVTQDVFIALARNAGASIRQWARSPHICTASREI